MSELEAKLIFQASKQKSGEEPEDNQDAHDSFPRSTSHLDHCVNRVAISDGATQTFYPAPWAKLLSRHFCHNEHDLEKLFAQKNWSDWLAPIQEKWQEEVIQRVNEASSGAKWGLRNRLRTKECAGATFIGLQFNLTDDQPQCQVMIIGDSCLFHLRERKLLRSYLLEESSQFDSYPDLFTSRVISPAYVPQFLSITVEAGDLFILATDALAEWILKQCERDESKIFQSLTSFANQADFEAFVEKARCDAHHRMEDDDVTLMIVSVNQKEQEAPRASTLIEEEPALSTVCSVGGAEESKVAPLKPSASEAVLEEEEPALSIACSACGAVIEENVVNRERQTKSEKLARYAPPLLVVSLLLNIFLSSLLLSCLDYSALADTTCSLTIAAGLPLLQHQQGVSICRHP